MKDKVLVMIVCLLILAAVVLPSPVLNASPGLFQSPLPGLAPNDKFANATRILELPFSSTVDTSRATVEPGERKPICAQGYPWSKSVWYVYSPANSGPVVVRTEAGFSTGLAAYTGTLLGSLTQVASRCWGEPLVLELQAGTTYYFQVGDMNGIGGLLTFYLDASTPQVTADFSFSPADPSVFDTVSFANDSSDPLNAGWESATWDFGDGTSSTEWSTSHTYAADGAYVVQLTVTAADGRSASTTKTVGVTTHDVTIEKVTAPGLARVGQTRGIVVGLNSHYYLEQVEVNLYKTVSGGEQWLGSLVKPVAVRLTSTGFLFSYTFTAEDAALGTVTFRATATLLGARDAVPADNEAVAAPTRVSR